MPAEILVLNILALAVEHAKTAAQIPLRPALAGLPAQHEIVLHESQRDRVGRPVEHPPFTHVHADALLFQVFPGLDAFSP
ncbi:MAG TPA: hypothetical protein VNZ64_05255 [Candidatus Acidoferrum sp.]|nr:hypothetical protein [Candidatus Acidoferrum sp.]